MTLQLVRLAVLQTVQIPVVWVSAFATRSNCWLTGINAGTFGCPFCFQASRAMKFTDRLICEADGAAHVICSAGGSHVPFRQVPWCQARDAH